MTSERIGSSRKLKLKLKGFAFSIKQFRNLFMFIQEILQLFGNIWSEELLMLQ